ncbi:MAG: replication factor C large subunit [archaeon]
MGHKTLCEKYRADCYADIKGQDLAIQKAKNFVKNFPQKKKAIILHGPAGTGKTSLVYAIANETNSEIFELNASDLRNKDKLRSVLSPATIQASLSGRNKIILVDEVEGVTGSDRGGIPELSSIIDASAFPVLITANNIWDKKFAEIRKKAEIIQLKELNYSLIMFILSEVAKKEKLQVEESILKTIAIKARGDVRAALNDLQTIENVKKPEEISERDKEADIFNILKRIFKETSSAETLNLYNTINMSLDEVLLWLEENIPKEYKGEELAKAIYALSSADVFRGRIHRQQHWRFLLYQNILMSAGVSSAKKYPKSGFTLYQRPTRILKIWMINQKNIKKKSIAGKYAKFAHVAKKRALSDFNIIRIIIKDNQDIQKRLDLSQEEIEYLKEN